MAGTGVALASIAVSLVAGAKLSAR